MRCMSRYRCLWGALAIAAAAGCGPDRARDVDVREMGQAASPEESAPDTQKNVSPVNDSDKGFQTGVAEREGSEVATLKEVRVAAHDGYERIVFEFEGALPGYKVEYIDRPVRQC